VGGAELPSSPSGGSLQLPVGPWRGAEQGCVCCVVLRSVALWKSLAEWLRKEGTGERHGLVVSLSGPATV